jgi:hypothetical protein
MRKLDYPEIWRRLQAGMSQAQIARDLGYSPSSLHKAIRAMLDRNGPFEQVAVRRCPDMEAAIARCDPLAPSTCDRCRQIEACRIRVRRLDPVLCELDPKRWREVK